MNFVNRKPFQWIYYHWIIKHLGLVCITELDAESNSSVAYEKSEWTPLSLDKNNEKKKKTDQTTNSKAQINIIHEVNWWEEEGK